MNKKLRSLELPVRLRPTLPGKPSKNDDNRLPMPYAKNSF